VGPQQPGVEVGAAAQTVIGLAYDAGATFAIVAPTPPPKPGGYTPADFTCSAPGAPREIQRLDPPTLQQLDAQPQSPFF
jgi:hypothetical protein